MPNLHNPSEVAREALRQLALRRIAPTPDNYRSLYNEIAGVKTEDPSSAEQLIKKIARQLPRDTADRQSLGKKIDSAIISSDREEAEKLIDEYLERIKTPVASPGWNELIGNLIRQFDARHAGWTTARKREALERVLSVADPSTLNARLHGLLKGWGQASTNAPEKDFELKSPEPHHQTTATHASHTREFPAFSSKLSPPVCSEDDSALTIALRQALDISLRKGITPFLASHPDLRHRTTEIADEAAGVKSSEKLSCLAAHLESLALQLEAIATDDFEVHNGLLELLKLLLRNINELVSDDRWLSGQVEMLQELFTHQPTPRSIDDANRRLNDLALKQGQLKGDLAETQRVLKEMLAEFVDQLARFSESTGTYHDRIASCAQRIAKADVVDIGPLLEEVMRETLTMQDEALRSRHELVTARERAKAAELRVVQLQSELAESSRLMRHDQLTGILNRRGLEEMFEKEIARAERQHTKLALALLDIDHFKRLNDLHGHITGDQALVHLSRVVREHLRPQDTLSRFGGEEFLILLPETSLPEAYQALVRLQRELTRCFFMAGQKKVVMTFSAGVTQVLHQESLALALQRADAAMYQAKQAGRNQVFVAECGDRSLSGDHDKHSGSVH